MENEIDKLLKEKKASMEAVTITAIPIASNLASVPTTAPLSIVVLVTTTIPVTIEISATPSTTLATTAAHPNDEAIKLIKAMQDMSIQTTDINRLKEQVKILEDEKKLAQIMYKSGT